jgi:hypothetical protein
MIVHNTAHFGKMQFLVVMNTATTGFQRLNYVHADSTPKLAGEASIEHLEAPPNVFHVYTYTNTQSNSNIMS